ncbi:hypothetical protein BJ170DRAFT_77912 [Xylariales sp. AK1849]|nr:hypothetical protein BJ170DRAFT_77912 [Xylariales sp. AK1849]
MGFGVNAACVFLITYVLTCSHALVPAGRTGWGPNALDSFLHRLYSPSVASATSRHLSRSLSCYLLKEVSGRALFLILQRRRLLDSSHEEPFLLVVPSMSF